MAVTGALVLNSKTPGPGQYFGGRKRYANGHRYSMRAKTLNPYSYTTARDVPGPGQYNIVSGVSMDGRQYWSKYKSSKCRKISASKITRFQPLNLDVPGPTAYSSKGC